MVACNCRVVPLVTIGLIWATVMDLMVNEAGPPMTAVVAFAAGLQQTDITPRSKFEHHKQHR
jgi:hypothetical protein